MLCFDKQKKKHKQKNCYSPFARTPYNPHNRQNRIKFIIFSDSAAASRFQIQNMKLDLVPLLFFPSGLSAALSADVGLSWAELREITQLETAPELQCNFFPSFWIVARIYTVPTVQPPDIGLPWQPCSDTPKTRKSSPLFWSSPVVERSNKVLVKVHSRVQTHAYRRHMKMLFPNHFSNVYFKNGPTLRTT